VAKKVLNVVKSRRAGDLAGFHASADAAKKVLGWQSGCPQGYVGDHTEPFTVSG
jgi:UDP-glucose 4-epimerase